MIGPPPRFTTTYTLVPYPTRVRSHQGKFRFSSSSHGVATPSEGARQSPRGDKAPPAETLGPLGSAERLNWLKPKKRLRKTSSRSEEHTSELQSLMRRSYAVFCLK